MASQRFNESSVCAAKKFSVLRSCGLNGFSVRAKILLSNDSVKKKRGRMKFAKFAGRKRRKRPNSVSLEDDDPDPKHFAWREWYFSWRRRKKKIGSECESLMGYQSDNEFESEHSEELIVCSRSKDKRGLTEREEQRVMLQQDVKQRLRRERDQCVIGMMLSGSNAIREKYAQESKYWLQRFCEQNDRKIVCESPPPIIEGSCQPQRDESYWDYERRYEMRINLNLPSWEIKSIHGRIQVVRCEGAMLGTDISLDYLLNVPRTPAIQRFLRPREEICQCYVRLKLEMPWTHLDISSLVRKNESIQHDLMFREVCNGCERLNEAKVMTRSL